MRVEDVRVPGAGGAPEVRVRLYRPAGLDRPAPALLWIHGGGFIFGRPEQDELSSATLARELGIVVAAVDYRLAPEHPFPAALDDCHAALKWLATGSAALAVRKDRIAIGGASAGGGLAAALAQLAYDRGEVAPVLQLLVYPMLDDRTATRTDVDGTYHRLWSQQSNLFGWTSYLGRVPGSAVVPDYSVAARRPSLSGLPPAWIGVGAVDLFHDEDVAYAGRLVQAGVPCELHVIPGAYHGFDVVSRTTNVVRQFRASYVAALREALLPR